MVQISGEVNEVLNMLQHVYDIFGFTFELMLSTVTRKDFHLLNSSVYN